MTSTHVNWQLMFDGFLIGDVKPSDFESWVISLIPDLKYWSQESLVELKRGLLEETISFISDVKKDGTINTPSEKARLTKLANVSYKSLKQLDPTILRDVLLKHLYDKALANDGHQPLRGFGFSNRFGDRIRGNAERSHI